MDRSPAKTALAYIPQYSAHSSATTLAVRLRARALFSTLTSIKSATTPTTSTCTTPQAYSRPSSTQTTSLYPCHTHTRLNSISSTPPSTSIHPISTTPTNTPYRPATTSASTSPPILTLPPVSHRLRPSSPYPSTLPAGSLRIPATPPIPPLRAPSLPSFPTLISDRPPSNAILRPPQPHRPPLPQHSPLRGVKAPTSSSPVVNGKHPPFASFIVVHVLSKPREEDPL